MQNHYFFTYKKYPFFLHSPMQCVLLPGGCDSRNSGSYDLGVCGSSLKTSTVVLDFSEIFWFGNVVNLAIFSTFLSCPLHIHFATILTWISKEMKVETFYILALFSDLINFDYNYLFFIFQNGVQYTPMTMLIALLPTTVF